MPKDLFLFYVTEEIYAILCEGTKPISKPDIRRFVRGFYALPGKFPRNSISPTWYIGKRYEKDVKRAGMGVGDFLEKVFRSRDSLVSERGGYWQEKPELTARQLRKYRQYLGKENGVEKELSRISEQLSFDFVALIVRDRYEERGRRAYHPGGA